MPNFCLFEPGCLWCLRDLKFVHSHDSFYVMEQTEKDMAQAAKDEEKRTKLQKLFEGLKFFLGRETNLESLTLVIRSCSGKVCYLFYLLLLSVHLLSDFMLLYGMARLMDAVYKFYHIYHMQVLFIYFFYLTGILGYIDLYRQHLPRRWWNNHTSDCRQTTS